MMEPFRILDVTAWASDTKEALGSKEKEWLRPHSDGEDLWLFKAARQGTGDDWAEKVAEQLASLIGLPHAVIELARRGEQRGVVSQDFRKLRTGIPGRFVPGNELLWRGDENYPRERKRKVAEHTVDRVLDYLLGVPVLPPITGALGPNPLISWEVFGGYLMFDAWIGNQDRHHENWGILAWEDRRAHTAEGAPSLPALAPSFDHASSLGQNETDMKRAMRLDTKDKGASIETWARKATSPFYRSESASEPLSTMEAFGVAFQRYSLGVRMWLARLAELDPTSVDEILHAVPSTLMTPTSKRFTSRMLQINRADLLHHFSQ